MAPSSLGFPGSSLPIKSLPSLPSSSHLGPCHLLLCSFILCTLYSLPGCLHGHPLSSALATPCAGESACGPDLPDTHTHLPPSPNVQDFPAAITSPNASTFIFPPSAYWHPTSHHKIGMSSLLSLASSLSRSSLSGPLTHPVNTYLSLPSVLTTSGLCCHQLLSGSSCPKCLVSSSVLSVLSFTVPKWVPQNTHQ